MKTRKPNTLPVWIGAGCVILIIFAIALFPASKGEQGAVAEIPRNEPETTDEAETAMTSVYGNHMSKFPVLWRTSATADNYEVEESWFQYCLKNEAVFMGHFYQPGLNWIRSSEGSFTAEIKAGTGITYKLTGRRDAEFVDISVAIVSSPVSEG